MDNASSSLKTITGRYSYIGNPCIVYPIIIYTIPINSCLVLLSNALRNSIESQLSLAVGVFS